MSREGNTFPAAALSAGNLDACDEAEGKPAPAKQETYDPVEASNGKTSESLEPANKPSLEAARPTNEQTFRPVETKNENTSQPLNETIDNTCESTKPASEESSQCAEPPNDGNSQPLNQTTEKIREPPNEEAALRLREEDAKFAQLYAEWRGDTQDVDPATAGIPKFYFKLPASGCCGGAPALALAGKLREEARAVFLQRRGRRLLTNAELKELWALLDNACLAAQRRDPDASPAAAHQRDQMLTYAEFLDVARAAGPKCAAYLTASVFARLRQREAGAGRVSALALFNYVMRKVWHQQTRIGLSLYDVVGRGFLREIDLENYIVELVPTLPQLDGLERSFHSFYVCTAVRKFLFFLDPLRTGRVRIRDILACPFLDELLELRDAALPKEQQQNNWFSAPSALRVYGQYLNLDTDHNGMLSRRELQGYGTGTLTSVFMSRVFQECLTYDGEMDYKTYLDFVLAMEHRAEPQALHYLFKILDVDGRGFLTPFTLNFFFRAIQEQMSSHGQEVVRIEDVKDEIFDMVKPADPSRITLQDLIACGHGDTMVSILIDLNGFWTYENREAMACDTGDGSAQV